MIVANWQSCWKWISFNVGLGVLAVHGSVITGLAVLDPAQRDAVIHAHAMHYFYFVVVTNFLQTFGRLVNQTPPSDLGNGAKP